MALRLGARPGDGDIAVHKRRFMLFIAVDVVMVMVIVGGLYAEFARSLVQARPVWIAALLVGFAAQLWFILGFRKSVSGKGD